MTEDERRYWEKVRVRGRRYYILTRGVLGLGLGFGSAIVGMKSVFRGFDSALDFVRYWVYSVIFVSVLASLYLRAEWEKNERRFFED